MKINSKILIIAGSDSSGGAGIQADIKSVTSLGSYAMTAITAVTAQNTKGVKSITPIPIKEISYQIEFTSKDIRPDSVKIGMLHSTEVIDSVLKSIDGEPIATVKEIVSPASLTFKILSPPGAPFPLLYKKGWGLVKSLISVCDQIALYGAVLKLPFSVRVPFGL